MLQISINALRSSDSIHNTAILDLLQLNENNLIPGSVSTKQLQGMWRVSQPQVSRRIRAIEALGLVQIVPGYGRYLIIPVGDKQALRAAKINTRAEVRRRASKAYAAKRAKKEKERQTKRMRWEAAKSKLVAIQAGNETLQP